MGKVTAGAIIAALVCGLAVGVIAMPFLRVVIMFPLVMFGADGGFPLSIVGIGLMLPLYFGLWGLGGVASYCAAVGISCVLRRACHYQGDGALPASGGEVLMAAAAGTIQDRAAERPRHPLVKAGLVGFVVGLLAMPLLWCGYFLLWVLHVGSHLGFGSEDVPFDVAELGLGDLGLMAGASCVFTYFAGWVVGGIVCYALAWLVRKLTPALRRKGGAAASPPRWGMVKVLAAEALLLMFVAGTLAMVSGRSMPLASSPEASVGRLSTPAPPAPQKSSRLRYENELAVRGLVSYLAGIQWESRAGYVHLKGVKLPDGGTRELYQWLDSLRNTIGLEHLAWLIDDKTRTMRDLYGHELVYHRPSSKYPQLFDLYSVGPNGIDEHGAGDDVTFDTTLSVLEEEAEAQLRRGR